MKCSLGRSSFFEDISSLSHSIILLLCIVHLRRPSYLPLLFSGILYSVGYVFPFSLAFCFSSFLCSVQSLSCVWLFATPWIAACQASLSFTISQNLLKLMSIESKMPSNHLILCCPLLLLPSIFHSIRVFSEESALPIRWPMYWSFSNNPSYEYSGWISFRIDWFDHHTVQGTLKSLLQHHNWKAPVLWHSAFFMTQLSLWSSECWQFDLWLRFLF